MPQKRETGGETTQFSVTVSTQAASMIEQLIQVGLHGSSRAEVTRNLIHSRLEQLFASGLVTVDKFERD